MSRMLVTLAVAALLSTSLVATPASATPRAVTSASVTVSVTSAAPGQTVVIRGTLKKGTRAFSGARVSLQQRPAGSQAWTALRNAVTNSAGQVGATVKPTRNYEFRLAFAGSSSALPAVGPARSVAVRQSVTVTKYSAAVDAGDSVTLAGTTSPALGGRPVTLQIKSGAVWKNIAMSKVSSTKNFAISAKASGRGKQYFRVAVSGVVGVAGAVSVTKAIDVYAWYALETVPPLYRGTLAPQANWRIAGKTYARVLGAFDDQFADVAFTYGKACRTFRTGIGMMDRSEYGLGFYARTDTAEADFGTMKPGQTPRQISMNLTGSDFLLIGTYGGYTYDNHGFYPAYIGSRISCTTEPGYFVL